MSIEVSVLVLNYNGKQYLDDCFASLEKQSLARSRFEIIMIDNGSSDGSVEHARRAWPGVRILETGANLGFAEGNNFGAKKAEGKALVFLNNDTRVETDWLERGLKALRSASNVGAVGSKILAWDGKTLDFAGGAAAFYGHGFKVGSEEPDGEQFDRPGKTLFASGCAMFIWKELFLREGGFDPDYFAFFEDVDIGWRLWVLGYKVLYEPTSIVYHHHHGTAQRYGYERERFLLERNALYTIAKNLDDENVAKILPASAWLAFQRGLSHNPLTSEKFAMTTSGDESGADLTFSAMSGAHFAALAELARNMDKLMEKRAAVQAKRKVLDREILGLFKLPLLPNDANPDFLQLFGNLTKIGGIDEMFAGHPRVLVITGDTVSERMAGPAIRAWEMANHLSQFQEVRLLAAAAALKSPHFEVEKLTHSTLKDHLDWADVVVFQGFILHLYPEIAQSGKIIVADIYDPFHLENLEVLHGGDQPLYKRIAIANSDLHVINEQLRLCDFFVCASEKQRDFWLGQLAALGRINLQTYEADPTLRDLLRIVPFGIPSDPPVQTRPAIKGTIPGIEKNDRVILWGGGVYNWFDPLTVIRAVDQVRHEHPEVKLLFMGMSHPNPDVPEMKMAAESVALAHQLGLVGTHVFFNEGWVPYEDRVNFLLDSDIGVSCHLDHVETTYSFRTRVLDYFWAGLPVIVTQGDSLSEIVQRESLGITVEPGDVDGFADAIRRMVTDPYFVQECKLKIEKLQPDLSWTKALEPLVAFCANPTRAPDSPQGLAGQSISFDKDRTTLRWVIERSIFYWRKGGLAMLRKQIRSRLRRSIVEKS